MTPSRVFILAATLLVFCVYATTDGSSSGLTSKASLKAMERVFARSERAHSQSMATIIQSMSPDKALQVLEKRNLTSPALIQITSRLLATQARLRQPKGYSGIDGARKLLNDMIYESMSKYDGEIARCTEYYSAQCATMEENRGQISASNNLAANSRALILDSQATINKCEVDIPTFTNRLKQHLFQCKHELIEMNARLKIIRGDIQILTTILGMTQCNKAFVQTEKMSLLRCHDACTQTSFITFAQDNLKEQIGQLQASVTQGLLQDTFKDLFTGIESLSSVGFLQLDAQPVHPVTPFNNPPLPRVEVPANPCDDQSKLPTANSKRSNKCTIAASPQCAQLQERFLLIQSGVEDERDNLLGEIQKLENYRDETKATLQAQIQNDQDMLRTAQVKLAEATTKEANAGETARQTETAHRQANDDLKQQMKTCSTNYMNSETELCALKKIRGELYKMKGSGHSAFFQDCEVAKWEPDECSKACGGGVQQLTRTVLTHPNKGAKCLPLTAVTTCKEQPCPIDCELDEWQGWSKCSAECGGGVQQRLREVKRAMRFGGKPCGLDSQTRACHSQSCESDCELRAWSKWSDCSKDCDGGTQKRDKTVKVDPKGAGSCPSKWSRKRLQYKQCNRFACLGRRSKLCSTYEKDTQMYTCATLPTCCNGFQGMGLTEATVQCIPSSWATNPDYKVKCDPKPMQCKNKLDVVLLLDGSGSLKEEGWKAEIMASQMFVDAFAGTGAQAQMAVVLYSGPNNWKDVRKCMGSSKAQVDVENVCKIKSVTHFTDNMPNVKTAIAALKWPKGSTLTSLALQSAKTELTLGRKDARSVVVVLTDGRPLSYRKTYYSARAVRKVARLVWVPITRRAPLRKIKRMATRRWQENVELVKTFEDLKKPAVVNHVVADICPNHSR